MAGRPEWQTLVRPQEIGRRHHVADFTCGKDALDDYLKRRAYRANAARDARVFVTCNADNEVMGYYTISAASVSRRDASSVLRRNAPDPIPMALIGRFAVHTIMQGRNLGRALLRDAILRISQASDLIGIKGIFLHAMDEDARQFYLHLGFQESLLDDKLMMVRLADVAAELSGG
ncbi:MAG: GNAT family N-acetyltransferase [Gammaproteobacteria bacterium]|nr:MAG: GNAT family N-acetyltransferase [Gammaproteobacteria bacterium]